MNPGADARGGPFSVRYVAAARRAELAEDSHTLALIGFRDTHRPPPGDVCDFDVALPQLADTPWREHWRSPTPVERLTRDGARISRNADVLFAYLELPAADIAVDTRRIYARILELLRREGYPQLLRVWNYFPHINAPQDGLERYRAFCVGRHQALETLGAIEETGLPAASALGSRDGPLQVYFLAAREPGTQIENPRQVSAFRYPERYSPCSPSFSRALLKRWPQGPHLYVSGTASIVGHESRHDHAAAQLDETLTNVETLVARAHALHGLGIRRLEELDLLKIYLREPALLEPVRDILETRLGGGRMPARLYLHGTVCRADLLLEIEGMYLGGQR